MIRKKRLKNSKDSQQQMKKIFKLDELERNYHEDNDTHEERGREGFMSA